MNAESIDSNKFCSHISQMCFCLSLGFRSPKRKVVCVKPTTLALVARGRGAIMSVKSLLEASYSKQKHHRSVYHRKEEWKRRVRAASHQACHKALFDPDYEFSDLCIRGRHMGNSKARSARRTDIIFHFLLSRRNRPFDVVMSELRVCLGSTEKARFLFQFIRHFFVGRFGGGHFYKGSMWYRSITLEVDQNGFLRQR